MIVAVLPTLEASRDRDQVWHRIAFQSPRQLDDDRRHDEADGVIDEKGREHTRHQDHGAEQDDRVVRPRHGPAVDQPKKARQPEVGDDDHHAEQEGDRVEVDGLVSVAERNGAASDHQGRAEERCPGPVELKAGQLANRDHDVGGSEDDNGGNAWRVIQG